MTPSQLRSDQLLRTALLIFLITRKFLLINLKTRPDNLINLKTRKSLLIILRATKILVVKQKRIHKRILLRLKSLILLSGKLRLNNQSPQKSQKATQVTREPQPPLDHHQQNHRIKNLAKSKETNLKEKKTLLSQKLFQSLSKKLSRPWVPKLCKTKMRMIQLLQQKTLSLWKN